MQRLNILARLKSGIVKIKTDNQMGLYEKLPSYYINVSLVYPNQTDTFELP